MKLKEGRELDLSLLLTKNQRFYQQWRISWNQIKSSQTSVPSSILSHSSSFFSCLFFFLSYSSMSHLLTSLSPQFPNILSAFIFSPVLHFSSSSTPPSLHFILLTKPLSFFIPSPSLSTLCLCSSAAAEGCVGTHRQHTVKEVKAAELFESRRFNQFQKVKRCFSKRKQTLWYTNTHTWC